MTPSPQLWPGSVGHRRRFRDWLVIIYFRRDVFAVAAVIIELGTVEIVAEGSIVTKSIADDAVAMGALMQLISQS